jgi:hypothetical protein
VAGGASVCTHEQHLVLCKRTGCHRPREEEPAGVQEPGINPTGGAIPRWGGPLDHRAGERGLDQPPSGGVEPGVL